jgi:hypothetical protein
MNSPKVKGKCGGLHGEQCTGKPISAGHSDLRAPGLFDSAWCVVTTSKAIGGFDEPFPVTCRGNFWEPLYKALKVFGQQI